VPISVSASGGISPYIFNWNDGDTNLQRIVNPLTSTLYRVTLIDKCNQSVNDSVLVTLFPKVILSISANPSIICKGQTATLNVSGANSYLWTSNIPDPSLQSQNSIFNPLVKPMQSTLYYVSATDVNGCKAKDSINISVLPSLNPAIIVNPNPVSIFDPTVHFMDASIGSVSWFWSTGDGFTSNQQNFFHTYSGSLSGNYTVSLVVSNSNGCTDSTKVEVVVFPELKIYIPNAFSPDYPNLNNVFKAYGEGIAWFEMLIYNRWGELLFTSHNIEFGWDGKFLNEEAPPGVYVYSITYKDISGKKFNRTGSVTLVR
jgi:gliding motility-associated-like protein